MKKLNIALFMMVLSLAFTSCTKEDGEKNTVTLHFNNTFKNSTIVLGDATSTSATTNTSAQGQVHHFSELKYVISNIRLIKANGTEIPYNINDLDNGATVINQSKSQTLDYVLSNIPVGEYTGIKFGLGVKTELNTLDQVRFPKFYAEAGANDTQMMWEWGTGYRFTKLEGFYDTDNKQLSIHTGSTVAGTNGDPSSYTQGVDAYRDITLALGSSVNVNGSNPKITIKADFDLLLNGKKDETKITLGAGNATPSIHSAAQMVKFVNNLGGNGADDISGIFSVQRVEN